MAKSPETSKIDRVSLTVKAKGKEIPETIQVLSIYTQKAVNKLPIAEVVLMDGDPRTEEFDASALEDLKPGNEIEILAGYHSEEKTIFKGIITGQRLKVIARRGQLTLKCTDKALKMTATRNSKNFAKQKDSAIISSLIGNHGLSKQVDATNVEHKNLIQYHASDWDFMMQRAEANGLVVLTDDGKVSVKAPKPSGSADLEVTYGEDIISFDAEVDSRFQLKKVSSQAWDGKKLELVSQNSQEPSLGSWGSLDGKKLSEVPNGEFEWVNTAPLESSELKELANAQLIKSRLSRIRGFVRFQGNSKPKIGGLITLSGLSKQFNGDAYVTQVVHELVDNDWQTEVHFGLPPEWFYHQQKASTPPAGGLLPSIPGLHNGKVKQIHEDPNGETRILVDLPLIGTAGGGVWARLANPYSTESAGIYFMPEVGDEVILGFLNDDPRFPIILGTLYGKKKKPPYTPDQKNKTKAIVTKAKLTIEFDEEKKIITIKTPKGQTAILDDDGSSVTLKDSNQNKLVLDSKGITLDTPKDINLKAKGKINAEALSNVSIKSKTGNVTGEGLNVEMKAQMSFAAQGNAKAELKAAGQAVIKGAMVMIN